MKIKCPNCSSSYKIDGSKLSNEGVYAKCSNCANIFFVRKRTESEVAQARKKLESKKSAEARAVTPAPKATEIRPDDARTEGMEIDPGAQEMASADHQVIESRIDESEISAAEVISEEEVTHETEKEVSGETPEESSEIGQETMIETDEQAESSPEIGTKTEVEDQPSDKPDNEIDATDIQANIDAMFEIDPSAGQPEDIFADVPVEKESPDTADPEAADSQEDIDALLAENAPAKEEVPDAVAEPEAADSQEDIDALLAENAPAKEEVPDSVAEPEAADSQEDIDALLAENAPAKEEVPDAVAEPEAADSQADIDALLAENAPAKEEVPDAVAEPEAADSQEDIDALLAENVPAKEEVPDAVAEPEAADSQADIDALLAENAPSEEAGEESQDSPDYPEGSIENITQKEIETLTDSKNDESEENSDDESIIEQEESDIISQDDIDALLSTEDIEEDDEEEAAQDDEEEIAVDVEVSDEEELDKLLSGEEEDPGGDLSDEDSGEGMEADEDQDLDDQIPDGEEEEEEAMLGIPSEPAGVMEEEDESDAPILPVEVEEIEKAAPASIFEKIRGKILELTGPLLKKILKAPQLSLPKKLSKGSAIIIGSAGALVIALAGGGYWFFYGSSPQDEVAMVTHDEVKDEKAEPDMTGAESLIDDSLGASEDEMGNPEVNLGIFYPVEFDAEIGRVMNVDVDLVFENSQQRDDILGRAFFSIVTVENAIGEFFKDKFFQDTMFAQEKLELYLNKELKKVEGLEGLKLVRLDNLTFEE